MSSNDLETQNEELEALSCILDEYTLELNKSTSNDQPTTGTLIIEITLPDNFQIKSKLNKNAPDVFHQVEHLPPVFLRFNLPKNYPSVSAPSFEIESIWLNEEQIACLTTNLTRVWFENEHEPILFVWYSTIGAETLEWLQITDCLNLSSTFPITINQGDRQQLTSHQVATVILRHEREKKIFLLHRSVVNCPICVDETYGSECFFCYQCSGIVCKSCAKSYLDTLINEGQVKSISCPTNPSCNTELTPAQIRSLVSREMFHRYDRLLFQSSLESMGDIIYCPRCENPVIATQNSANDINNRIGECATCFYVFCTICRKTYHGINPCQYSAEKLREVYHQYRDGSPEERAALEKQYGKIFNNLMNDMASMETIASTARQCPKCSIFVDKLDGCNKMTCTKCRCYFCWICLKQLSNSDPYGHFSQQTSPCFKKLFEGVEEMEFW